MPRYDAVLVAFLLLFSLAIGVAASSTCSTDRGDYIFYDDFENASGYNLTLWTLTNGKFNGTSLDFYQGSQSLAYSQDDATVDQLDMAGLATIANGDTFEWRFKIGTTDTGSQTFFILKTSGGTTLLTVGKSQDESNSDYIYYDGSWHDLGVAQDTQWHTFKLRIIDNKAMIYLDDTFYANVSITPADIGYLRVQSEGEASGINYFADEMMVYTGETCPSGVFTAVWNATSGNVANATRAAWNTADDVDIKSDLLSFTATTSSATNMSCRLDVNQSYADMVAADANYKAATTETTSHAYTVYDPITDGAHSLYCSFVDATAAEVYRVALPVMKFTDKNAYVMYDLSPADFSINSMSYTTVVNATITLAREEQAVLLTSGNALKPLPPATTIIGRIALNGIVQQEGMLAALEVGEIRSLGFPPLLLNLSAGVNHLSFELYETSGGQVQFSNLHLALLQVSSSEDNHSIAYNLTAVNRTDLTHAADPVQILHLAKPVNSGMAVFNSLQLHEYNVSVAPYLGLGVMLDGQYGVIYGTNVTQDVLSTIGAGWYFRNETAFSDQYVLASTAGISYAINSTSLLVADRDLDYDRFMINSTTSPLSGFDDAGLHTYSLGAGTHTILQQKQYGFIGTGIEYSFTGTWMNIQGVGNITVRIDQEGCSLEYQQGFDVVGDLYTTSFYGVCNRSGNDVNVSVIVPSGMILEVFDEGLLAGDTVLGSFDLEPLPPLPNSIVLPVNDSVVKGITPLVWEAFDDPNGDLVDYNLTAYNASGFTALQEVSVGSTTPAYALNMSAMYSLYGSLGLIIEVKGIDSGGLTGSSYVSVYLTAPVFNLSLLAPANGSVLTSASTDFTFRVDEPANCTLFRNDSAIASVLASAGNTTFGSINTSMNGTYTWRVDCANATRELFSSSETYDYRVLLEEAPALVSMFSVNVCPATTPLMMLLVSLMWFAGGLIIVGWVLRMKGIAILGSLLLLPLSWIIVGCYALVGWVFVGVALIALIGTVLAR